jgi:hypothetical protein
MNTITSIAHDHNLDRKTVEYAVSKAKRDHGDLGQLKEVNRINTRFFTEEETNIILTYLPQSTRGSQTVVETSIVTVDHEFQALQKHDQPTTRVGLVPGLDVELDLIQNTVLTLVAKAEQKINQTTEKNLQLLNQTQQTYNILSQQVQRLQQLEAESKMKGFVVETLVENQQASIKDLLGKLQNSL